MNSTDFQKLLYRSAVSVMAVDGEIHETEIEEIKAIARETAYFLDFDYEKELIININEIRLKGKEAINEFLSELGAADLNERQEIILVEVIIRMIEADHKIDPNEIKFLQLIKAKIKTTEETLLIKFPKQADYLIDFNNWGTSQTFDSDIKIN